MTIRLARHALRLIAAIFFLLPPPLFATIPDDKPLVLGVAPYLSANQIMEQFSPLREYIEETLGQKVTLISAPDVMSFVNRTSKGEYDLILTGPHMGRFAQQRDGWQSIAQSSQKIATLFLVRDTSKIQQLKDLRGKKMAIGLRHSIAYLQAEEALAQSEIVLGKDIEVINTASFSNVVQSVLLGETDVGAIQTMLWDNWKPNADEHRQLRVIYRSKPTTPFILVMTNPKTDEATIRRLTESLLRFKDTPKGAAFFLKTQLKSFLPLDEATMKGLDPYVHVLLEPEKTP